MPRTEQWPKGLRTRVLQSSSSGCRLEGGRVAGPRPRRGLGGFRVCLGGSARRALRGGGQEQAPQYRPRSASGLGISCKSNQGSGRLRRV